MSQKDYVPDSYQNLRDWAQNFLDEIDAIATRIQWPGDVAALKARLTRVRNAADGVITQQNALALLTSQLETIKADEFPEIRRDTGNLKTSRGFTKADARTLDVLSTGSSLDPATYRPDLAAETRRGHTVLSARKRGADSLNVYWRRKGESEWRLLAAKRVRFPLNDNTPPAVPGQPEEREYQAIGVVGDDEVGHPSAIASAVFRP